jgi:hypothetical protein
MRGVRWFFCLAVVALTPASVYAQAGITPLRTGPIPLARRDIEFRGYVTIEDDFDLFAVYRQGVGGNFDFGVRAGYSDIADGGFHFGGDLRYGLPWDTGSQLQFALAGGAQFTLADAGNRLTVPFGISIGADVGDEERAVVLYGLPKLMVVNTDPDVGGSETDLEFGVEMGGEVEITANWIFDGALTIATNNDDNIELALGIVYRR